MHGGIAEYAQSFSDGRIDAETFVVDVLATLRHFADVHAIDYENADRIACNHYAAEGRCRDCGIIIPDEPDRDYCGECIEGNADPATLTDEDRASFAAIRARDNVQRGDRATGRGGHCV